VNCLSNVLIISYHLLSDIRGVARNILKQYFFLQKEFILNFFLKNEKVFEIFDIEIFLSSLVFGRKMPSYTPGQGAQEIFGGGIFKFFLNFFPKKPRKLKNFLSRGICPPNFTWLRTCPGSNSIQCILFSDLSYVLSIDRKKSNQPNK